MVLKSPYPYFGGKSRVASAVWERFGNVRNFVEPFFGSGAVLLGRPEGWTGTETVNDLDAMVPNFWRAVAGDPDAVAHHADWPVSECDLHARHLWLVAHGRGHVERCKVEPEYYDAKIAGWWVWGLCQWIGGGWCANATPLKRKPSLWHGGMGVHSNSRGKDLLGCIRSLSDRMRRVRFCCGDWSRVCTPTVTSKNALTAVFLDPPYAFSARGKVYAVDQDCAADVRKWCHERGDDKKMRIALCGYAGEGHESLEADGWQVVAWKAHGGYANIGDGAGKANAKKERIWFSPHCLPSEQDNTATEDLFS